jgi:Ca2+-binding EF-hand superfamily protein
MTRTSVSIAAAVAAAIAIAAGAVAAQGASQDKRHHARIDANGDGVVDRSEAAAHPRLAQRFDQLDRNGDGRLDATELGQWKGKRAKGGRGGMGMHGGIARLDADGDGRISRVEVAGKARLAEKFDEIDANRDGYIVRAEMQAWHERMRPQREAARAERFGKMFAEADLNGDGRLSRVEVTEKLPRLAERFEWLDSNGDGFLDRSEMQTGKRR